LALVAINGFGNVSVTQDFQQDDATMTTIGFINTQISLNGTWKFNLNPPASFWENSISPQNWSNIQVPGECTLQGFKIEHDKEYPFKKQIYIPSDFKNKRILLRFDGVYSAAHVWVNGQYIRSHSGGFTTWYCDIIHAVKPGEKAWVTVGVTDRADEISDCRGYAFHLIEGFLRGDSMLALPENHISKFSIETDLDKTFQDAVLKLDIAMYLKIKAKAKIHLTLSAPDGT
jgi:beta-galactosidase